MNPSIIQRSLQLRLQERLWKGKVLLLFGARQTGKTTLIQSLVNELGNVLWLNADEYDVRAMFEQPNSSMLKNLISKYEVIVLDEAQRINDIGLKLKLITDSNSNKQIIVTGSSALDLASKTKESLTGRTLSFQLFPLSFHELMDNHGLLEEKRLLANRVIFGSYPDVVNNPGDEKEILHNLTDSMLYKDLLMIEGIKKPQLIVKLLQALAFQIGNQVSYNELGKMLGVDNQTIEKYVGLLEQAFIIFRLGSFSRNLRKELKKSRKIYFWDLGIRNALISQFNPLELRNDTGALWENYWISERIKFLKNTGSWKQYYFWRTTDQQELDWLEVADGAFEAFELKWKSIRKWRPPIAFSKTYESATYKLITPENYYEYLVPE